MMIYEMTATFGKLEHQHLCLKKGLNVIYAPNEWGKSTWCAFLIAMFYGIDTRAKSTRTALADKEKYVPWSGSPMEGRIDLNWQGRDITIERSTKGRIPLGAFSAYETATGLEIPELTAVNCGQMLLGVEKSVFTRAGFIRQTDLPVTQDGALRRRLNGLVTAGDESGAGDLLADKLRDLKNRVRYNRTGLLPQTQAEYQMLEDKLAELDALRRQTENFKQQQTEAEQAVSLLNNHRDALRYAQAQEDQARVEEAEANWKQAKARVERLEKLCREGDSKEGAEQKLFRIRELQNRWMAAQLDLQKLPERPSRPEPPAGLESVSPEAVMRQAEEDGRRYRQLQRPVGNLLPLILGLLGILAGIGLAFACPLAGGGAATVLVGIAVFLLIRNGRKQQENRVQMQALSCRYGSKEPDQWLTAAKDYVNQLNQSREREIQSQCARDELERRIARIHQQIVDLTGNGEIQDYEHQWQQTVSRWEALAEALRDCRNAEQHLSGLRAMAVRADPSEKPDTLEASPEQTGQLLSEYSGRIRQLEHQLGQCRGRMEAIGDEQSLRNRQKAVGDRINELKKYDKALELAQKTLEKASEELQRRFAPRISARAGELFADFTDNRYDRLSLTQDLTVHAGAEGEDTLRTALWRSDGTVDQLYLSVRLAVAEELTPEAPVVLDDVLTRFDDRRMEKAMDIFRQLSDTRQVILFSCQRREANYLPEQV